MTSLGVRPVRLGFIGTGSMGQRHLQSVLDHGGGAVLAVADPDAASRQAAIARCVERQPTEPQPFADAASLLATCADDLDGVVIATPSQPHMDQTLAALSHGLAVYCQKPLARTAAETWQIIEAARLANRRVGVDYRYRGLTGVTVIREAIASGTLGRLTLIELIFHSAYGPDTAPHDVLDEAAGGCVMDLGGHLVDLLGYVMPHDPVHDVLAARYAAGEVLAPADASRVEDFAVSTLRLESGATVHLSCSWRGHVGRDADIQLRCHGTEGGLHLHNRTGSFAEFELVKQRGTTRQVIGVMDDRWVGQEITRWVEALGEGGGFAADEAAGLLRTAVVLDAINGA